MANLDIAKQRFHNQHLAGAPLEKPEDVVRQLCAVQAQDYVASHGPATLRDYAWWSGLSAADTKAGLEMVKSHFTHETANGEIY